MTITKETTLLDIKRAIRNLKDMEVLEVEGWGQVQKIGRGYAICKGIDDSDIMRDYSAWCYGWTQTNIANLILADM